MKIFDLWNKGMSILKLAVSIFIFTLSFVNIIEATPPPDMIMAPIKQINAILNDPDYQKSGRCPKSRNT